MMRGTITVVSPNGGAYFKDSSGKEYFFLFTKIQGYGREKAKELTRFSPRGLVQGVEVDFELNEAGMVELVKPVQNVST